MNGKIKIIMFVLTSGLLLEGCSSKSFIFGNEEGFCSECGFRFKGVCANPMDIYYNSDLIMNKPAKCQKNKNERVGVRK